MEYRGSDPFLKALHYWSETFMQHAMRGMLAYAKQQDLSLSRLGALFRIHHDGSCGMADLSETLGISGAAASQLADRLVNLGLLDRFEDENDRRAKRLQLTPRGDSVVHGVIESRHRWLETLADSLSADERGAATPVLRMLAERTNQMERPYL
jgi:DNA-binding MarR family transcriptional regulator